MKTKHSFWLWIFIVMVALAGSASGEKRWVYVSSNLYVNENMAKLEELLQRAQRAGYNGVLFTDYKMCTWWKLDDPDRWQANAQKLRALTRQMNMELVVCVFPFGYAGSLLWHDVNLASGMEIRQAPLQAVDGVLQPVATARIANGSFEDYKDHQAKSCSFQDNPGTGSFIDTEVKKEGKVSIRFEAGNTANSSGNGRICQEVAVKPHQQYRLRAWMKTGELSADQVSILVMGGERVLQWQYLQIKKGDEYSTINQARQLTTGWVEQSVTFNSLDYPQVRVYLGIWGGRAGKIWWDDLRIEDAPALNILRRLSLPLKLESGSGVVYEEGRDVEPVADPLLGKTPWPGSYETRHAAPVIRLAKNSRIKAGDTVLLSGYHATLVYDSQVNCSLNEPKVFDLCRQQIQHTEKALQPDGYFMSHDEIRNGGWEPNEISQFKTSGELLAYNIKTCREIIRQEADNRPVYVWSDMFDPQHNAHDNYYLVNNTLAGSWEGLPSDVVVMKWGEGENCRAGMQFFAGRGHAQMIAGYYDQDVTENHRIWQKAGEGISNLQGVMYTTWENNYSQLEKFASEWWGYEAKP